MCVLWSAFISFQAWKDIREYFNECVHTYTHTLLNTLLHAIYARKICMWGLCVPMRCVWRAIWSSLQYRGPCEVLSAWPLRSPVATEGLLHSTSSPGSQPQKRKFGSFKWRGCSWAIYRALYRSSATHDIPYEDQCVCGACGVVWCVSVGGWGGWRGKCVCMWMQVLMQVLLWGNAGFEFMYAGTRSVSRHTNTMYIMLY